MHSILLTGCAGFIGSHVAERLLRMDHRVVGIDNFDPFYARQMKEQNLRECRAFRNFEFHEADLKDPEALAGLHTNFDFVIHIAAKAGVLPSVDDPRAYIDNHIVATQNVLEFMREKQVRKLLFASSSSIYGNNEKTPFHEADSVDHPISPYAFTKRSCELMNHTYHHLYGLDILNLRFFTVYGPRQRPDLAIHKFIGLIDRDEPVTMFGDGSTARDYTFINDTVSGVVNAMNFLLEKKYVCEIVNLGNNHPVELKTLIDTLYELLGKTPNIRQLPMQPGDVNITYADISKAGELFGYRPRTSLREGLKSFIEWYYEQKDQGIVSVL